VSEEIKTRIATIEAPYRREIWLDDMKFESDMNLLRVTIKEGRRFTQIDLDAATAKRWAREMNNWAEKTAANEPSE
jgi:hypothetical protein